MPTTDADRLRNEQFKETLHTAWNEPRFFFFCLALLGICGIAAAAMGAALIGWTGFLVGAAVVAGLCFILGMLGFFLAWIPPVRRLFEWLLRRRFRLLGCLAVLVALFYAIENWRGRRAWQEFKREQEAKGERFDLASLVPPSVPSDQNFFETPLFSDLRFGQINGAVQWSGTPGDSRVVFDVFGPAIYLWPRIGDWMNAQRVDLQVWQALYRGTNNSFPTYVAADSESPATTAFRRRYGLEPSAPVPSQGMQMGYPGDREGPPTNYFPIAKEPQTPAADVLLALSRFETNRQLLIAAAARPQARFWINYDAGYAMLLPHLARLRASADYLSLHATAALKAGDQATALEDVQLLFRVMESIHSEPKCNSQLVRFSLLRFALQPVWDGLADRQWSEADARTIASALSKLDFLADYQFAMRSERAHNLWGMDYIRNRGSVETLERMVSPERYASRFTERERLRANAAFRLCPDGWFDQNKVSLCRIYEQNLLPLVALPDRRLAREAGIQQLDAVPERRGGQSFNLLATMLLPDAIEVAQKAAHAQTCADLARVACALERYRLSEGEFPESLVALVPKFLEKLPHDVINGQPLKYHRTDDGQFVLYSVGWNEADEGGRVVLGRYDRVDISRGDWVWRYPARTGAKAGALPSV